MVLRGTMRAFLRTLLYASLCSHSLSALALDPDESHGYKRQDLLAVPLPSDYTTGDQVLCLSPEFSITFGPALQAGGIPNDLEQAARRVEKRIWTSKHRYLSVKRGLEFFDSESDHQGRAADHKDGGKCKYTLRSLRVDIEHGGSEVESIMHSAVQRAEDRPELEKYSLSVPLSGPAVIKCSTALGAFRGLTTFENLFFYLPENCRVPSETKGEDEVFLHNDLLADDGQSPLSVGGGGTKGSRARGTGTWYAPSAPYLIEDKPAFGWRAVMLDTSRNWFSKASILKVRYVRATIRTLQD